MARSCSLHCPRLPGSPDLLSGHWKEGLSVPQLAANSGCNGLGGQGLWKVAVESPKLAWAGDGGAGRTALALGTFLWASAASSERRAR